MPTGDGRRHRTTPSIRGLELQHEEGPSDPRQRFVTYTFQVIEDLVRGLCQTNGFGSSFQWSI